MIFRIGLEVSYVPFPPTTKPSANDYSLFNPDLHAEKLKQQHSNFLMTPCAYHLLFIVSNFADALLTVIG